MLRRLYLPAALAAALALPASAHATTFTVDPAAVAGCSAANVCKTITEANAKVADGDTVEIKDGAYTEVGPILVTKKNITFHSAPNKVVVTQTDKQAGTPVFNTGEGTTLDGLVVSAQPGGGPAITVAGPNTVIKQGSAARLVASPTDAAAISVAAGFGDKTTISKMVIIQNPPSTADGVAPVGILGSATNSLQITDSFVLVGEKAGAGIAFNGGSGTKDAPIPNQLTRSSVLSTAGAASGVVVNEAASNTIPQKLEIDSSIISSGPNGVGIAAAAAAGTLDGSAGAEVDIIGIHVTIAGGDKPVTLDAAADPAGGLLGPGLAGPVNATFTKSIIHGKSASTVTTHANLVQTSTKAKLTIDGSDATDAAATNVAVTNSVKTSDDVLFADVAKRNFHLVLGSPAIDKAGGQDTGASTTDVDSEKRVAGTASDYGADEFNELAPKAVLLGTSNTVKQGQLVGFDASKSSDPNPGDAIVKYTWDFGDGVIVDTTTAQTTHAYATSGQFTPKLTVTDKLGTASEPGVGETITVVDGTPPAVAISAPKSGKSLRIFKTKKTKITKGKDKGKVKVTKTRQQFSFSGTSSDAGGAVETVQLSLRRVSLAAKQPSGKTTIVAAAAAAACTYLDGKTSFKSKNCKSPLFFYVKVGADGAWSYKTKKTAVFKAGKYELTAKATDKAGNATTAKITFTLK